MLAILPALALQLEQPRLIIPGAQRPVVEAPHLWIPKPGILRPEALGILPFPTPMLMGGGPPPAAAPDANTLFLCRFNTTTPTDEVSGATGTLADNAFCDTANSELVLDGSGDYVSFANATRFDPTPLWTIEFHSKIGTSDEGAIFHRSGTNGYYIWRSFDGSAALQGGGWGGDAVFSGTPFNSIVTAVHFALTFDGTTIRSFRDGVFTNAFTRTQPGAGTGLFYIGTHSGNPSGFSPTGRIARMKLSNVVRYPGTTTFTPPARTDL